MSITGLGEITVFLSTPSARRATKNILQVDFSQLFLSTPSARRATYLSHKLEDLNTYFYPRPLRGGRRFCAQQRLDRVPISIHALCEEGDLGKAD